MADTLNLRNDPRFALLAEHTEATSWLDLTAEEGMGRPLRCETIDDTVLIIDESEDQPLNRVLLLGVDRPARPELIARIIDRYQSLGIDSFSLFLSPIARPTTIPRLLTKNGFARVDQQAVVVRSTDNVPPLDPYFRIRQATVEDTDVVVDIMTRSTGAPEDWGRLLARRLLADKWRYYLAYDGSTPYAIGGLHLNEELGWLPPAWTLEGYRNRGTQFALLAHAVRDAAELGCEVVTTSYPASAESRTKNFQRLGFELVYMRPRYIWTANNAG